MWTLRLSMGDGTRGLIESQSLLAILVCMCCLTTVTQTQEYEWQTTTWGECYKPTGCGNGGTQIRRVTCKIFYNGAYLTTHTSNCKRLPKPINERPCFKVCNEHRYQVRWAWNPWGDCQLEAGAEKCAKGKGIQYRDVSCVWKENGRKEKDSVCSEFESKPASQQRCELRCPQDCVVTQFSDWSGCDSCRYLNKTRTRTILIPNNNGGQVCPPFSEQMPCEECSESYFYSVQMWSPCESFASTVSEQHNVHPLIGHQKRTIKCVNTLGTLVNHRFCIDKVSLKESIGDQQACIIPKDCIVSEWSSWDRINSSCIDYTGTTRVGLIKRFRKVLQLPMGSGKACPSLEEVTEVQGTAQRKCPRARWIVSSWSTCLSVNSLKQCRTGLQHRTAICVEENYENLQKPVPDSFCSEERPLTSQTCRADCHWDCTVSLWSSWSECRVTDCEQYARKRRNNLKTGQRYRTREILTLPGSEKKPCDHLSETQNCDPEPCYNWKITTGLCSLSNANIGSSCGRGTAHRTLACLNKYKLRVADSLCLEFRERPAVIVDCEIPCPNDCVISNWGEWTECPDRCQRGQIQQRATKSRKRTILARPFAGGKECPTSRYMEQTMDCPTLIECDIFMWRVDHWSSCQLEDVSKPCGRGTQQRNVNCYDSNRQVVPDEKCTEKVKPVGQQICTVACPQDCTVTNWSDWSECSASCWQADDISMPTRSRRRYILQQPTNGGSTCPDKLTDIQRCVSLPMCNKYRWDYTDWSECVLPPIVRQCGKGLRARNVTCKSENSTVHPIDVCLRFCGAMPEIHETCYVTCEKECLFSDWSGWSECVGGCNGKQFRHRQLVTGEKSGPSICSDTNDYSRYDERQCYCKSLERVVIGDWSECILMPVSRSSLLNPHLSRNGLRLMRNMSNTPEMGVSCGTGKRYKVVACKNNRNAIDTAEKCTVEGKADFEEEVCVIPCQVDCEMYQWSQWSRCPTSCGAGVQERYRHIKQLPSAGGRRCPSLDSTSKEVQTRLCHPECVQYTWKKSDWGMCIPEKGHRCGDGQQSRHVNCKAVNVYGVTTKSAGENNCAGLPRPMMSRSCFLPCRGDCVVSEWTEYSPCNQPCNRNQQQVRTREIMREPDSFSHYQNECPPLKESRQCIRGDNCIEYMWEFASWTTCLVNNGLDDCGVGHKERYAICKNHFDRVVDNQKCREVHGPVTEPLVVSCEIPCDVDCLLSDWSPWSACSKSCGLGVKKRDRSIVQQFIGNGRPCSNTLSQTMQCFARGCYTWNLSEWSPCATQAGVCGFGVQHRNITCLGDNGQPVDSSRCPPDLTTMVAPREQVCHIPCPGECVTTDWSAWSECYIKCVDFNMNYRTGIRSRSRAILAYPGPLKEKCPEQPWTSEACQADSCTMYIWVTGPWIEKTRKVWCERDDGLKVIGGCDPLAKPPTVLSCVQPCDKLNAYCNDTDQCACHPDYFALFKDQTFIGCFMDNKNDTAALSAQKPDDGATNIWMYAVIAAGTIFVIFVTIALYNMSDFMHYGPRPRNRSSTNDLNTTTPNSRSSTLRNNPDSVVMMDNCDVCKHIPSPVTPPAHVDTMPPPPPNDRADTKCHISVGSCVRALDNSEECNRFSDLLARFCPCTKTVSMHEYDSTVVKEHDISMTSCTSLHDNSPDESNVTCTTALLDKAPLSRNGVKLVPIRSDSEHSGYTQYSDSTTKEISDQQKHSSSDSAISVSVTTNSVTGTSVSSTPYYKQEANLKSKMTYENDSNLAECRTSSSLKSLENVPGLEPLYLMNEGSFDFIMQDLTKKIDSLSRGQGPTFSASGQHSEEYDKYDSDSEEDALLGNNPGDTSSGNHALDGAPLAANNNVHAIFPEDLYSTHSNNSMCINNVSKHDDHDGASSNSLTNEQYDLRNSEGIPGGISRNHPSDILVSYIEPKSHHKNSDLYNNERSRPRLRGDSSRREGKPRLIRQQKLPDRYIEQGDSGNYEADNNSCSSENVSEKSPKHRRFSGLSKRGNSDSGHKNIVTGPLRKSYSFPNRVTMDTDDGDVSTSQGNYDTTLVVETLPNKKQWKETVL